MQLTKHEELIAQQSLEQSNLYEQVPLLTIKEQVALDIFSSMNEYQRVASTVEAPILDNTNVLYFVDGIDTDSLFNVLNAHKRNNRTLDTTKEEDSSFADKNIDKTFKTNINEIWNTSETWIQSEFGNMPWYVVDNDSKNDDNLRDQNLNYESSRIYQKQQALEKKIMTWLENLWKEYHHRLDEKNVATGERYIQCERHIKVTFNKIKKLEELKNKLEQKLEEHYFKYNLKPEMDKLLSRYVDWQQKQLKMGKDPSMTREEAILQLKPKFYKYLSLYNRLCQH